VSALDPACRELGSRLEQRIGEMWWLLLKDCSGELSRTGAAVLATLRESGPLRVTELADREAVAQPSMTCLLNRLERDALIERQPDPVDRRAIRAVLTARGRAVLEQRADRRAEALGRRLERLDAGARAELDVALAAFDEILSDGAVSS